MNDNIIEWARGVREQLCGRIRDLSPLVHDNDSADTVAVLMLAEQTIEKLALHATSVEVVDCTREHVQPRRESALWIVEWLRDVYASLPRPGVKVAPGRHRIRLAIDAAPSNVPGPMALPPAPLPTAIEAATADVNPVFTEVGPLAAAETVVLHAVTDGWLGALKPPKAQGPVDWHKTEEFVVPDDIARDMQEATR